jgi:hypothetical protein
LERINSLSGYDSKCCSRNNQFFVDESIDSGTSQVECDYQCARRGCKEPGKREFEIKYTNMVGYFCDSCSSALITLGLIVVKDREGIFHSGMNSDSHDDNDKIQ